MRYKNEKFDSVEIIESISPIGLEELIVEKATRYDIIDCRYSVDKYNYTALLFLKNKYI